MSWQSLTASKKVKAHTTSKRELDDLRDVIERDLADATIRQPSRPPNWLLGHQVPR